MVAELHTNPNDPGGGQTNRGPAGPATPRASGLRERDAMVCRSCGKEERASEGYPCASCGTFICLMCVFKGVVRCAGCEDGLGDATDKMILDVINQMPRVDWPEH